MKKFFKYSIFAVIAAVFIVSAVNYASGDELKASVVNYLRQCFSQPPKEYDFSGGETYYEKYLDIDIPEGYNITEFNDIYGVFANFQNGEKYFSISVHPLGGSGGIDTEDAVVREVYINGHKGISSVKEDVQILLWIDDYYKYCMDGNIGEEELIKIAESVFLMKNIK